MFHTVFANYRYIWRKINSRKIFCLGIGISNKKLWYQNDPRSVESSMVWSPFLKIFVKILDMEKKFWSVIQISIKNFMVSKWSPKCVEFNGMIAIFRFFFKFLKKILVENPNFDKNFMVSKWSPKCVEFSGMIVIFDNFCKKNSDLNIFDVWKFVLKRVFRR